VSLYLFEGKTVRRPHHDPSLGLPCDAMLDYEIVGRSFA
jgi:hypothetical protein